MPEPPTHMFNDPIRGARTNDVCSQHADVKSHVATQAERAELTIKDDVLYRRECQLVVDVRIEVRREVLADLLGHRISMVDFEVGVISNADATNTDARFWRARARRVTRSFTYAMP